jgi:hypothetical protein
MHHVGWRLDGSAGDLRPVGIASQLRLVWDGLLDRSGSEHHRRFDRRLPVWRNHGRQLKAAFDKLICRWRGKADELNIPPFKLRQAAARTDFGLKQPNIALGECNAVLDLLQFGSLRGDVETR